MKKRSFIYLILVAFILSACTSKKKQENTINISGAYALYPLVVKWAEEYKKDHENVQFNISAVGAGQGMADALESKVDLGLYSSVIEQEFIDKGVWWVGLCKNAVLPTVYLNNPYLKVLKNRGLKKEEFKGIFIDGTISDWNEILDLNAEAPIRVYTRNDASGAAGTWAKYLGGQQKDLKGIKIQGDSALLAQVIKDPEGIAFNNTSYIYNIHTGLKRNGIEVIPLDLNANGIIDPEEDFYDTFDSILEAIEKGNYPSPPSRELFIVARDKPDKPVVIDFINWSLTDGQKFIRATGYVPLEPGKIKRYLDKLN
ncbi:PstS family phosphate ABC transporter substrate-binding protein [Saccharicrinis sp. FJH54]|uniref:PstS family phosphate ABC transporter substrate-binding protein n=1 Tax=Saccharicrinis sp. FJH54 TaxID=3344665 RepID=UPI0035D4521C